MAVQLIMSNLLPDKDGRKANISSVAILQDVIAGQVSVAIGDSVPKHRALETLNGWRWLWNGLRDRNLLTITNVGTGPIYTYADIDSLTEFNRRTTWTGAVAIQANDIVLMIHNDVAQGVQATVMLESAVAMLIQFCKENNSLETV